MSDITCARCGEPWDGRDAQDAARHPEHSGDLTYTEAGRFLKGEGCPSCNFGAACPNCSGTGKASSDYRACCLDGRTSAWSPGVNKPGPAPPTTTEPMRELACSGFEAGRWYVGYLPNVRLVVDPTIIKIVERFQTADGPCRRAWIVCPYCAGNGDHLYTCRRCRGSGKLEPTTDEADELRLAAGISHCNASDEEPIGLLNARGI